MYKKNLIARFDQKAAVIGIIGLGYVGLPLVLRYIESGYKVIGFDTDFKKIAALNEGESYIGHIASESISNAVVNDFVATNDYSRAKETDALIICVPTPLNKRRDPDLSFVISTMESLLPYLAAGQVVSLESTTYPGTTEEELRPRIESTGLTVGVDTFLVFSPEREDPGNKGFCTRTIPKVCGGVTANCLEVGIALYRQIIDEIIPVSSTQTAEMVKLLENIHRAVNIGLVNEMKIIADKMGIDIHEVIRAAATKPFGFVPYYPGPGLGGHCIPIDPFYLVWKAREYGINSRFIELAGEVNSSMPEWVAAKIVDALNKRQKSLNGSDILVLGVAYKKNIDDMRESPAIALIKILQEKGAAVDYCDPHVPVLPPMRKYQIALTSVKFTPEVLGSYDCVVIITNHDVFDYETIKRCSRLIIDTRGVYLESAENIVKA